MAKFKGIKGLKKEDLDKLFEQGFVVLSDGTHIEYDESTIYVDDEPVLNGLPLGTIISLAIETDDPCLQKLDGRSLAQDGMYAEFCTWLKNRVLANSSNVPTCTIEEYATEMNTYTQCGKFVINDTNSVQSSNGYSVPANSIKLPTITEFIASNNGGDAIGLAELDEFKSHNHTLLLSGNGTDTAWGAVVSKSNNGEDRYSIGGAGGEETRPKNIRYPYYIVVATATKTDVQINLNNVANDINSINSTLSKTEQVEVIYDMKSNDISINMKHEGGIYGGTWGVFTIDTKYRRVRVYAVLNTREVVFEIDLTPIKEGWTASTSSTGITKNQNLAGNGMYIFYGVLAEIDSGFNFTVRECFSFNVSTNAYTQFQEDTSYYVHKVEGVL